MFDATSQKMTDSLIHNEIIATEDRDLYCYGIQQGLVAALNFITTIIIGCLCGMFFESIIYMISYIPLRHYAGGFHAKTPARCYVFSIFMLFSVFSAMKRICFNSFICSIIVLALFILISIMAPVADRNKPLDNEEYFVYRKRTVIIAAIETVIVLTSLLLHQLYLANCILWCLMLTAIMMWMGLWKAVS